jgi:hypothetical protein
MLPRKHPNLWLLALGCFILTGCQTETGSEESSSWYKFGSTKKTNATTAIPENRSDNNSTTKPVDDHSPTGKDAVAEPNAKADKTTQSQNQNNPMAQTAVDVKNQVTTTDTLGMNPSGQSQSIPPTTTPRLNLKTPEMDLAKKDNGNPINLQAKTNSETTRSSHEVLSLPEIAAQTGNNSGKSIPGLNADDNSKLRGKMGGSLTLPELADDVVKKPNNLPSPNLDFKTNPPNNASSRPLGWDAFNQPEKPQTTANSLSSKGLDDTVVNRRKMPARLKLPGFTDNDSRTSIPQPLSTPHLSDQNEIAPIPAVTPLQVNVGDKVSTTNLAEPLHGPLIEEARSLKTTTPTSITLSIGSKINSPEVVAIAHLPEIPQGNTNSTTTTARTPLPPTGSDQLVTKSSTPARPFRLSDWVSDENLHEQWLVKQNNKSAEELAAREAEQRLLREAMLKYLIKENGSTPETAEKK